MPDMISTPSPNFDDRGAARVDLLLIHYTGMPSAAEALARLTDREAKVSAHYFIEEDGTVRQLVDERHRAWHAGEAFWQGVRDINACSIGIELVNPGHEWGYTDFPEKQIAALLELAKDVVARHAIPPTRVLGHSDVAPLRKSDPGERFPWAVLAEAGIGWFAGREASAAHGSVKDPQADQILLRALAEIGYHLPQSPAAGARQVVRAFQCHYCPWEIGAAGEGRATPATLATALALARAGRP